MEVMRYDSDCEVVVIANTCNVDWVTACSALHWRKASGLLEVVYANPWNLYKALITLGYWKKNIVLSDLIAGTPLPGKTIVLLHDPEEPLLEQHWVTWHGVRVSSAGERINLLAWGNSTIFREMPEKELIERFRLGSPNCAFQVYKANFWQLMLAKVQALLN